MKRLRSIERIEKEYAAAMEISDTDPGLANEILTDLREELNHEINRLLLKRFAKKIPIQPN